MINKSKEQNICLEKRGNNMDPEVDSENDRPGAENPGNFNRKQDTEDVRSPDVYRRTGKIPVNAETPSHILLEHDITPVQHFYVRCHGKEPELDEKTHIIDICLEEKVVGHLTVSDLKEKFASKAIRMTLVCDGNRRKELNVIKRTNGFDWGCCAVSTGIFEGVALQDILLRFFDQEQLSSHRYVSFESADRLTKGPYAPSIPLATVMQTDCDVLVAFTLNGMPLTMEHGHPVRTVLPGTTNPETVPS